MKTKLLLFALFIPIFSFSQVINIHSENSYFHSTDEQIGTGDVTSDQLENLTLSISDNYYNKLQVDQLLTQVTQIVWHVDNLVTTNIFESGSTYIYNDYAASIDSIQDKLIEVINRLNDIITNRQDLSNEPILLDFVDEPEDEISIDTQINNEDDDSVDNSDEETP